MSICPELDFNAFHPAHTGRTIPFFWFFSFFLFISFYLWGVRRKDGRQLRPFKRCVLLKKKKKRIGYPIPFHVTWQSWCVTNSTPSWIESNLRQLFQNEIGYTHESSPPQFVRSINTLIHYFLFYSFLFLFFFCYPVVTKWVLLPTQPSSLFFFRSLLAVSDPARSKWRNEPRGASIRNDFPIVSRIVEAVR